MNGVIRAFQPADRAGVNGVARPAFSRYAQNYADWPTFYDRIGQMADLAGGSELLVAESEGEVLGAIVHVGPGKPRRSIFPEGWSVIRMLVVTPTHRGRGIGQQLVAACLRCAMRDGRRLSACTPVPLMASALRMCLSLGFTRDRALDPIHGVPYARYVLPAEDVPVALARLAG